jgi:hypothetical protein
MARPKKAAPGAAADEELLEIRKTIIIAIASDEKLMERLVLKGGNALDIVYRIGERSSLDVDFSMAGDFRDEDELEVMRERLFSALRDRFDSLGYAVFDEKLEHRPRDQGGPGLTVWGGYNAVFKLIPRDRLVALGGVPGMAPTGAVLDAVRREARVSGPNSQRVFLIEISKFEYCEGRKQAEVEGFDCYVYTPAMIAAEKLRAICQQLPAYSLRRHPAPRPRDFFDIHTIATQAGCDLADPAHHDLVRQMFATKEVPLELIAQIGTDETRAFHAQQWAAVVDSVRGGVPGLFDFYFDFVVGEGRRLLETLRITPAP